MPWVGPKKSSIMNDIRLREALEADVPTIVSLLSDDALGATREKHANSEDLTSYLAAFKQISASKDNHLMVLTQDDKIVGTFQITFIPNMTYMGGLRAQIEGVRIDRGQQGNKIGTLMLTEAIAMAKQRGAHLVQLTTDKLRPDAIQFYRKLGFVDSHEGFKMKLI